MNDAKENVWLNSRRQEAMSAAAEALPAAMIGGFEGYYDADGSRATRMLARYLIGEYASMDDETGTRAGAVLASFDDDAACESVGMAVAETAVVQARRLRGEIAEWLREDDGMCA